MAAQSKQKAPNKWKLFLLVWMAVYPMILLLSNVLLALELGLPKWVDTMLISLILVLLMLFFIMPFITSFFAKWLTKN